jgi:hypothetical protein
LDIHVAFGVPIERPAQRRSTVDSHDFIKSRRCDVSAAVVKTYMQKWSGIIHEVGVVLTERSRYEQRASLRVMARPSPVPLPHRSTH